MAIERIVIDFIDQSEHRYPTVGDYQTHPESGVIHFRITRLPNPTHSFAILIHEMVEKFHNIKNGVIDAMVDDWDLKVTTPYDEPGLDPKCPYHRAHMMADSIEREFILFMGEDWSDYENAIDAVMEAVDKEG